MTYAELKGLYGSYTLDFLADKVMRNHTSYLPFTITHATPQLYDALIAARYRKWPGQLPFRILFYKRVITIEAVPDQKATDLHLIEGLNKP